jgi:hypothetical protein
VLLVARGSDKPVKSSGQRDVRDIAELRPVIDDSLPRFFSCTACIPMVMPERTLVVFNSASSPS